MTSLVEIIEKKAKNEPLTDENIETFVKAVAMKTIKEAQIGKIKRIIRLWFFLSLET